MDYFVTDEPWPASEELVVEANGAAILHGVPDTLSAVIPEGTLGPFSVDDPIPGPTAMGPMEVIAGIGDCLEGLTTSSTSATVRNKLLDVKELIHNAVGAQ